MAICRQACPYNTLDGCKVKECGGFCQLTKFLDDMPTVDAVPVVRCKDCTYSYEEFGFIYCTFGPYGDCAVPSQFYCAEGKRNEDK